MAAKTTVKLNTTLCQRSRTVSQKLGYSSMEEFIEHAMEKELEHHEEPGSSDEVLSKLKGLGYLE
jgi:metal-responsive CopG/Arc/MetJ family transcriptional regulator